MSKKPVRYLEWDDPGILWFSFEEFIPPPDVTILAYTPVKGIQGHYSITNSDTVVDPLTSEHLVRSITHWAMLFDPEYMAAKTRGELHD